MTGATLAIAGALLLSACAGPAQPGEPGGVASPAGVAASADCLASGLRYFTDLGIGEPTEGEHPAAPEPGSLPEGFEAVQAVLCTGEFGVEIEGEQWQAVRETRYDGDLAPLLAALDVPSDGTSTGPCTADYEIVPELWLVAEDGQAIRAAWPTDSCGKTKPGVREALGGLETVDENLLPVAKIELADPLLNCLSELPPGQVLDGGTLVPEGELVPDSDVATMAPGAASDQFCP